MLTPRRPVSSLPARLRALTLGSLLVAGLATGGCNDPAGMPPGPPSQEAQEPELGLGCNPLGGGPGEDCFTPFPSSFYTRSEGAQTRLALSPVALAPRGGRGMPLDPTRLNLRDGYSPATPMLAYFPAAIDDRNLPSAARPDVVEASLSESSPVQVLRYDTGERVPILVELDKNAAEGDRQALVVYPQIRLQPKTRYVVAIAGLLDKGGQKVAPLAGFAAIRDGKLAPGSIRSAQRERFAEIFALLERKGLARSALQLAWDFTTGSDEQTAGRLVRMRDQAWAYKVLGMPAAPITVTKVEDKPYDNIARRITATLAVPSFLTDDRTGRLQLGTDGEPVIRGVGQFPLIIHVPTCAATAMGPVPVMVYGHGLFGGALGEMNSSYQREIINRLCMIQVGSDWIGLSSADRDYVVASVLQDFNNLVQLTDRLQQAHVNFATLFRLVRQGALEALTELRDGGRLLVDSKRVYYYGISNGGIQGLTALALSPDLSRAALTVPGGFWSFMMWRSSNFGQLETLIASNYTDALDRQILIALSQSHWDYTDPATYAPHVLRDLLPGSTEPKRVLYQEGLGDAQVPNLATRSVVRTMGLGLLQKPVEAVFGVGQVSARQDSAYVQYDIGQMPRPGATNVPPEKDNAVHGAVRKLEAAKQQLQDFLREGGAVTDTCMNQPCVFAPPT